MAKGKGRLKRLLARIKEAFHDFADWFQDEVQPELMDFAEDNKELIIGIIKRVAVEFASLSGKDKREKAADILKEELTDAEGNIEAKSWWIDTAIQMIYAILRSKGEIPKK